MIVLWIVLGVYAAGFAFMACLPQWRGDGLADRLLAGAVWPYVVAAVIVATGMPSFTPRDRAERSQRSAEPNHPS